MRRLLVLPIVALAVALLTAPGRSDEKSETMADELRLKSAHLGTDGASLVEFLSTRARGEATRAEMQKLIDDLESTNLLTRQKAAAKLVSIGAPAVPMLRMAAREIDTPDLSNQAKALLKAMEEDPGALSAAAIRLLANRRPPGTAEALLAYLPHAETDAVLEELKNVLSTVAYEKGAPTKVMLDALSDRHALRRATAIQALCAGGIPEPRAMFRKLLVDPKPSVRLRAALALGQASDPKAVSTLITLLPDVGFEQAKEIDAFLTELAGELTPKGGAIAEDTLAREKAREAWAKWWLDTEGTALLDDIRKRTLSEDDLARVQKLIEQLGDEVFEERQKAEDELKKTGAKILPLLRLAKNHADLEVRNRVTKCVDSIEMDKTPPLAASTPRLIALRKPAGAADAILAYLPFVDDDSMFEELQTALNTVAYVGKKASPTILKALADKAPARRLAAGVALCAGPYPDYLPQLRKVLADKDPNVRGKVALALATAGEKEAVPALIRVVADGTGDTTAAAEEYLVKLARDAGPKDLPEGDDNRKKRSAAWEKWWSDNQKVVVMLGRNAPSVRVPYLGYTLLIQASNNQIQELDKNNKPRWTISGLLNPWDAQILPGKRVLIAEYNGQRVTERDEKGDVKWEHKVPNYPMQAERLKNGHTFIVCRNMILQVDKNGKQIYKMDRPHDIYTARRLPNGQMVVVTTNRQIIRYDKNGKELKSFSVPAIYYHQNEILDNGHVLVPLGWNNRVVEYNTEGKDVWSCTTVMQPSHAFRLPNGNTIIQSQNWPNRVTEVDKSGKLVPGGEYSTNTYVFRARRR